MPSPYSAMHQLLNRLPQSGRLAWIGIRPARGQAMVELTEAEISIGEGLVNDRFKGRSNSKRQVTLSQYEHLAVMASLLHVARINPGLLRRNLVVQGINLLALKDKVFSIGDVTFRGTGLCHPCSKMESILGAGGYNAMRGHGGITASVLSPGNVRVGDSVKIGSHSVILNSAP